MLSVGVMGLHRVQELLGRSSHWSHFKSSVCSCVADYNQLNTRPSENLSDCLQTQRSVGPLQATVQTQWLSLSVRVELMSPPLPRCQKSDVTAEPPSAFPALRLLQAQDDKGKPTDHMITAGRTGCGGRNRNMMCFCVCWVMSDLCSCSSSLCRLR